MTKSGLLSVMALPEFASLGLKSSFVCFTSPAHFRCCWRRRRRRRRLQAYFVYTLARQTLLLTADRASDKFTFSCISFFLTTVEAGNIDRVSYAQLLSKDRF